MRLNYAAAKNDGTRVKGIIEAKDVKEAVKFLRAKELLPISVKLVENKSLAKNIPFLNKIKNKDLIFFTRQLSSMLISGLTVMQALSILKEQMQNPMMADVVKGIIVEIEEGKSLSQAIAKYPAVFSSVYISLISAAESSGLLDKALLRLADNLEKQSKLKNSIKSALMYPLIIMIGMSVVIVIMMVFVVPQLNTLYQGLNIELPLPTKIIITVSSLMTNYWPFMIGGLVGTIFIYNRWHKTENGKLIIDNITLKIPVFGKLIKETILTEFTRTLGLLISSGTLVVESLNQTSNITGNIHYKNAIIGLSKRVERGITMGDGMSAYILFPSILVEMVRIGEKTGKLDESLMRISEYYEREVDDSVKNLTTAMEPIIMVMLGVGVAFLIISIITPIYKLTSAI